MKLGISSLGHLVYNAVRQKFTDLNDLLLKATESSLEYCEKKNLKVCEIVLDPPNIIEDERIKDFIELCGTYSIEKQIHANFIDVSLCSFNPWISNATVESYIKNARVCAEIGAKIMTIHPGPVDLPIDSLKKHNTTILINAVIKLLDAAEDLGVNICIENMPKDAGLFLNVNEIEEFFSMLNRDDLFFTYDTSHFWTNDGNVDLLWDKFHKRIKNVHVVENNDKETDKHPQLGLGTVNFEEIFKIIKSHDYSGALIIEVFSSTALRNSINFIKQFL